MVLSIVNISSGSKFHYHVNAAVVKIVYATNATEIASVNPTQGGGRGQKPLFNSQLFICQLLVEMCSSNFLVEKVSGTSFLSFLAKNLKMQ